MGQLTCATGHHWTATEAPPDVSASRCPECGLPASAEDRRLEPTETVPAEVEEDLDGSEGEWVTALGGERYVIEREHARGGLGRVSIATDARLQRPVALKQVLPERTGSAAARQRFLREARVTAQLEHPNIVPVHDLGFDDLGEPYYIMKLVGGRTLEDAIREHHEHPSPVGFVTLMRRFVDVCHAVGFAHSRGVVHRDLKPSNVMVGEFGETLVLDWGLARRFAGPARDLVSGKDGGASLPSTTEEMPEGQREAEPSLTVDGQVLGTPGYMSPEQLHGRQGMVGPAVDVYALGVILYLMLNHRLPDDRLGGPLARSASGPAYGEQVRPGIPPALHAVCNRAMAREPGARYAGAEELALEVERYLADEPVAARPDTPLARAARWGRRHRSIVAAGTAALALAVFGLTLLNVLLGREQWRTEQARQRAAESEQVAQTQRLRAEERELTSRRRAYASGMNVAYQAYDQGKVRRALDRLDEQRPRAGDSDLRGVEWHILDALCNPERLRLDGHKGPVNAASLALGDTAIVSAGDDRTVRVWNAGDGRPRRVFTGHTGAAFSLAVSPDGRWAATGSAGKWTGSSDHHIRLWDLSGDQPPRVFAGHPSAVRALAFSQDGRWLAAADLQCDIWLWDIAAGTPAWKAATQPAWVSSLAFSPSGDTLVSADYNGAIKVWHVSTGEERTAVSDAHEHSIYTLSFTADGSQLLSCSTDRRVRLWEFPAMRPLRTFKAGQYAAAIAPNGQVIAAGTGDGSIAILRAADGRQLRLFRGHCGRVNALQFFADGQTLLSASSDGTMRTWSVPPLPPPYFPPGDAAAPRWDHAGLALSPDGSQMALVGHRGVVEIKEVDGGRLLRRFEVEGDATRAVSFAPDGTTVAVGESRISLDGQGWDGEGGVRLLDLKTGEARLGVPRRPRGILTVAFSPDGSLLVTGSKSAAGSGGEVRFYATAGGPEVAPVGETPWAVRHLAFSPDGARLAVAVGDAYTNVPGEVQVWEGRPPRFTRAIPHPAGPVYTVAFDHSGSKLGLAGSDGDITIVDPATGTELAVLGGHVGAVLGLAFSPHEARLVSAGADRTARFWDLVTRQEVGAFGDYLEAVYGIAFTADGAGLVTTTAADDGGGEVRLLGRRTRAAEE